MFCISSTIFLHNEIRCLFKVFHHSKTIWFAGNDTQISGMLTHVDCCHSEITNVVSFATPQKKIFT